ncbi:glycosyltransferase family 25 protein [Rhizobium sp. 2MFCol3.1]|uniref:glycosyltransferase family 25 protein n=1 Tax=Rhizobium sp. 2MFCol3.1 TaxID=1246459 RepID=UPI0012DD48A4|nr:glycosyltransferase family 25 protein [Rhizobium sp. 2MFCol3.1]
MHAATQVRRDDLSASLNAKLSIYLINLDRSPERGMRMEARILEKGLSFQRVAAVDGREILLPVAGFDDAGYRRRHGRSANPFEIGCYLSHVECARRLLASKAEHALILEDDLIFEEDLVATLNAALDEGGSWDILRLSTVNRGRKYKLRSLTSVRNLSISLTREKGSGAYVINRKAARWIVERLMPMRLPYDLAFDLEHLGGLRGLFVDPQPIRQSAERTSLIQNHLAGFRLPRSRYVSVLPWRAFYETSRFLARTCCLVESRCRGWWM